MSRTQPLPPELSQAWPELRFTHQVSAVEWRSECPQCGSVGHDSRTGLPDRFFMRTDGKPRGKCRSCGYFAFADAVMGRKWTPEEHAEWVKRQQDYDKMVSEKLSKAITWLKERKAWLKYHENLTEEGREWWHKKGVKDHSISSHFLGWEQSRRIYTGKDSYYMSPTATVPVFDWNYEIVNVRHRVVKPQNSDDKYRPERALLPSSLFPTDPNAGDDTPVILVEGEIKAIVIAQYIDEPGVHVVGVPGKRNLNETILAPLEKSSSIVIGFDPDAYEHADLAAELLGRERCKIASFPDKPDDLFVDSGMTTADFWFIISQAKRA